MTNSRIRIAPLSRADFLRTLLGGTALITVPALQAQLPAPRHTGDRYLVTDIGTITGFLKLEALGINEKGGIAGRGTASTGETRSISYPPLGPFATSADKRSEARGINDAGEVVVYASYNSWIRMLTPLGGSALRYLPYIEVQNIASGPRVVGRDMRNGNPVIWNLTNATWVPQPGNSVLMPVGTPTSLGALPDGASSGKAMAISESGFIAGYAIYANGKAIAFLSKGAGMKALGTLPGDLNSYAYDVNATGDVAGCSFKQPGTDTGQAFLWQNSAGRLVALGTLGGVSSCAYGVNDGAEVVGSAKINNGKPRAFHSYDSRMTDLNSVVRSFIPATLTEARAVNNLGQIAANGSDGRVYILTPPILTAVSVSSGSGLSASIRTVISANVPAGEIEWAQMIVGDSLDARNACYVGYRQSTRMLHLRRDDGKDWLPGIPLGSGGSVRNAQCTLSDRGSVVSVNGNTLTVTFQITFESSFAGSKQAFLYGESVTGRASGWKALGTWKP